MTKKKKSPTIIAPQTDDEANSALRELGDIQIDLAEINTGLTDAVARVKAIYEERAKPLNARSEELFAGLAAWAAANRERLTGGGKTKQAKLPAGTIGWRDNPPSVVIKRGTNPEDLIATLKTLKLKAFIRVSETVNKEAMLADKDRAAQVPGITIKRGSEQFYAEPTGLELAEKKT